MERIPDNFLEEKLRKGAQSFFLEGTVQVVMPNIVKIMVCGNKNAIENFIDFLHQESADYLVGFIEVEPFIKQKDYRGVFRIIE